MQRLFRFIHENIVLIGILILAFAIRVIDSPLFITIARDEMISIHEIIQISNKQNYIFSVLMNLWFRISDHILFLRLLPILFGTASLIFIWCWLRARRSRSVAGLVIFFLAISPIAVVYSWTIRFYAPYQLAIALLFYASFQILEAPKRRRNQIIFVLASIYLITSHLLAIFLFGFILLFMMFTYSKATRRWAWVAIIVATIVYGAIIIASIFTPKVFQSIYTIAFYVGAVPTETTLTQIRGWGPATVLKLIIFPIQLIIGLDTYLLQYSVTVPTLLVAAALGIYGLIILSQNDRPLLLFIMLVGAAHFVFLITAIEPLYDSKRSETFTLRYTIFFVPLIWLVVTEGIVALPWRLVKITCIVILAASQIFGLISNGFNTEVDFLNLLKQTATTQPNDLVIHERSKDSLYFQLNSIDADIIRTQKVYDNPEALDQSLRDFDRLIVTFRSSLLDSPKPACKVNTQVFDRLQNYPIIEGYRINALGIRTPSQLYVYDILGESTTLGKNVIPLPAAVPHPRYGETTLPQTIDWNAGSYTINRNYTLPTCDKQKSWSGDIETGDPVTKLLVFSNVVSERRDPLENNTPIAHIQLESVDGQLQDFPLQLGVNTQLWNQSTCDSCNVVHTWRKYAQLRGGSSYPYANADFRARIWGTEITLDTPMAVSRITVEHQAPNNVDFTLWGLFFIE